MTVSARAPCRIDLAGGTVDLWPLYLLVEEAATVNLAIDRFAEAVVDPSGDRAFHVHTKDPAREVAAGSFEDLCAAEGAAIAGYLLRFFAPTSPLSLTLHSEAPPQAGLGGSSALGIAIAGALNAITGSRYDAHDLVAIVRDVEVEVLETLTGAQDHYPPVFGGAMCLWWEKVRHRREPLPVDAPAFEERFLLAYSHQPHRSGATNWEVVKRFIERDRETRAALEESGRTAVRLRNAMVGRDLSRVAELMAHDWECRRRMAPAVSSPELESIIAAAREAGASGAKVCGAGGGGCMLIAVNDREMRPRVEAAVVRAGGSILDYQLVDRGLRLF